MVKGQPMKTKQNRQPKIAHGFGGMNADTTVHPSCLSGCVWTEDNDGNWFTTCGEGQVFETGGVTENHYRFCPFCGKAIKPGKPNAEVSDGV